MNAVAVEVQLDRSAPSGLSKSPRWASQPSKVARSMPPGRKP
ncbi:MAG: hypothetical protein U1F43_11475 [Myxococcota bacterium]